VGQEERACKAVVSNSPFGRSQRCWMKIKPGSYNRRYDCNKKKEADELSDAAPHESAMLSPVSLGVNPSKDPSKDVCR
jgi:hypothetical protein